MYRATYIHYCKINFNLELYNIMKLSCLFQALFYLELLVYMNIKMTYSFQSLLVDMNMKLSYLFQSLLEFRMNLNTKLGINLNTKFRMNLNTMIWMNLNSKNWMNFKTKFKMNTRSTLKIIGALFPYPSQTVFLGLGRSLIMI